MSFEALCQGKYPRYAITIYFLIGLLSFAVDLPVAMETTEHAEIELPVSRSHSSDGSHIKKKKVFQGDKLQPGASDLCKANEDAGERRFFVFLW